MDCNEYYWHVCTSSIISYLLGTLHITAAGNALRSLDLINAVKRGNIFHTTRYAVTHGGVRSSLDDGLRRPVVFHALGAAIGGCYAVSWSRLGQKV